ncbi:hypothetical protein FI667_g6833, partial [Globisporangium splendens]
MTYSRTTSIHSSRRKRTRLTASRLRRSRLLTEVAMRKLNFDPEKTEQMELISDQLSEDDIHFFLHIFAQINTTDKELDEYLLIADADGSKAIDLQEWIVLCWMLVKSPRDENELLAAFHCLFPNEQDIPVIVFRTKMQRILENAYAHIPECNQHEVSCYVDDILSALDPNNTECIRILSTAYSTKTSPSTIQDRGFPPSWSMGSALTG